MNKRLAAAAMGLAAMTLLTACTLPPSNGNGHGGIPSTAPPPTAPNPMGVVNVIFEVETFVVFEGKELPSIRDNVLMVVGAFDAEGKMGRYTDKVTGEERPGPQAYYKRTPWPYEATLGTGIVGVSVRAVFEGATRDQGLRCTVEVAGYKLDGYTTQKVATFEYGALEVSCLYQLPAGGFVPPVAPGP